MPLVGELPRSDLSHSWASLLLASCPSMSTHMWRQTAPVWEGCPLSAALPTTGLRDRDKKQLVCIIAAS